MFLLHATTRRIYYFLCAQCKKTLRRSSKNIPGFGKKLCLIEFVGAVRNVSLLVVIIVLEVRNWNTVKTP